MNRYRFCFILIACLVMGSPCGTQAEELSRSAVAEKVYAQVDTQFKMGQATVEDVYHWSVRWLESELSVSEGDAARQKTFAAHTTRMRALHTWVKGQVLQGQRPQMDATATHYFLLEAQAWQRQGAR